MSFRSIDSIKSVIEGTGLSISYLYDDLIFVKHNAYILRFDDDKPNCFFLHFNFDSDEKERPKIVKYLQAVGEKFSVNISNSKLFKILPSVDETFQVQFLEEVENV